MKTKKEITQTLCIDEEQKRHIKILNLRRKKIKTLWNP
jgi:hypothetical protein